MHEIAETRAAGRDEAFENILTRIKSAGGKIIEDETHPLYTEVGAQEFEIGSQRKVEFNLNNTDFQLIRNVENSILQGAGHQKHLEPTESPRIKMILKKKLEYSEDWQLVDIDEMF
ncbi:MAG: hypothetical protein AAB540_04720 [Patescibacteria group bacterium]